MHNLILLFGSNLGDKQAHIGQALSLCVDELGELISQSSLYETAPWGNLSQDVFINQVVHLHTQLQPQEVLQRVLSIEQRLGRIRHEKWGARIIDIDILYFDDLVMQSAELTIPHPYLHERRFTMEPLKELIPDWIHPLLEKTNQELLAECSDSSLVKRLLIF